MIPKRALLIVDVQQGMDSPKWGRRNNPDAEKNIARLLADWRASGRPVIHIQHRSVLADSPLNPNAPGFDFKDEVRPLPGEKIFQKSVNSAFIGTDLQPYLHGEGINSLVIVGLTTEHCVSTTTRMAGNLGFDVVLVSDGTAAFEKQGADGMVFSAEDVHNINLACLHGEFCVVKTTAQLLSGSGKISS